MTNAENLAAFVIRAAHGGLSGSARLQFEDPRPRLLGLRHHTGELGGAGPCTLMGGGSSAPDRAAFFNTALVRYLDFNDSYLARGETCHPSDNLAAVLAACEYANRSGRDFLTALAVAYQVQCRLSDVAPVRAKGFDHTTQGAYAARMGPVKP